MTEIRLEHVSYAYGQERILEDINLKVTSGEVVSILGPSGVGKTTLFNLIAGILEVQSGRIVLDGEENPKGRVSYMLQKDLLLEHKTVLGNIIGQRFEMNDKELEERIESYYDGENLFRSIKIHGDFSHMRVRMIPKSTSDRKFAEVAVNQPEYSKENVTGTIVGIWTPEIFHGVSLAGYHLHFVSDDLSFGGHVMDFVIKEGIVELGAIDQLDQRFPVQDRDYLFAKFNMDEMKEDIDQVE